MPGDLVMELVDIVLDDQRMLSSPIEVEELVLLVLVVKACSFNSRRVVLRFEIWVTPEDAGAVEVDLSVGMLLAQWIVNADSQFGIQVQIPLPWHLWKGFGAGVPPDHVLGPFRRDEILLVL